MLLQKILPPRQLNRCNTIKDDIVAVYQKDKGVVYDCDFENNFKEKINKLKTNNLFDTNDLVVLCIKSMLETSFDSDIDFKRFIGNIILVMKV